MKKQLRLSLGVAAAIVLLWAALLWTHGRTPSTPLADAKPAASAPARAAASSSRAAPPPSAARPSLPALRPADLIAAIELDKRSVCLGEDFLVSIRGKPENAGSSLPIAELDFNVEGIFGDRIALSPHEPGPAEYTVVASNGVDKIEYRKFSVDVLQPNSQACSERAWANVKIERLRNDPEQVEVRVTGTHGLDHPQQYLWNFGDGSTAQTSEPRALHSYALRDQSRGTASFVVAVSVTDVKGREAQGRASVHLVNTHFRARAFGERLVAAVYERWPRSGGSPGAYSFDVTFRSFEDLPVVFTQAALKQRSCGRGQKDPVQNVAPSSIGAPTQLEANATQAATLVIPTALVAADSCVLELELTGDSTPARAGQPLEGSPIRYSPVKSRLAFELRAAAPAEQGGANTLASRRVQDASLAQKLRQAAGLLGRARITPEELAELERQGKLAPVKPSE